MSARVITSAGLIGWPAVSSRDCLAADQPALLAARPLRIPCSSRQPRSIRAIRRSRTLGEYVSATVGLHRSVMVRTCRLYAEYEIGTTHPFEWLWKFHSRHACEMHLHTRMLM